MNTYNARKIKGSVFLTLHLSGCSTSAAGLINCWFIPDGQGAQWILGHSLNLNVERIIIIIIFINCNWVVTRWQWLFYMYTNMGKKVTRKYKSGGLHERHVITTWEPSQHSLVDTGKPRKTCVEVAGRRTFRILTSSQTASNRGIVSRPSSS
jgi:hypothetical protein